MGTAVVMSTRSPQTTGDEWLSPAIGAFQRTFHFVGAADLLTPDAFSPRNCGQFSPANVKDAARRTVSARRSRRMAKISYHVVHRVVHRSTGDADATCGARWISV